MQEKTIIKKVRMQSRPSPAPAPILRKAPVRAMEVRTEELSMPPAPQEPFLPEDTGPDGFETIQRRMELERQSMRMGYIP